MTADDYALAIESAFAGRARLTSGAPPDIQDRIDRARREGVPPRLKAGAEVLGRLWRDGPKCASGWSALCRCAAPGDFCDAKGRWVGLLCDLAHVSKEALEDLFESDPADEFWILQQMTLSQFDVTGVTVLIAPPAALAEAYRTMRAPTAPVELALLAFGPKGTQFSVTWPGFLDILRDNTRVGDCAGLLEGWLVTTGILCSLRETKPTPAAVAAEIAALKCDGCGKPDAECKCDDNIPF